MKGKITDGYQMPQKHPARIVLFGPKGEMIIKSPKLGFREPNFPAGKKREGLHGGTDYRERPPNSDNE